MKLMKFSYQSDPARHSTTEVTKNSRKKLKTWVDKPNSLQQRRITFGSVVGPDDNGNRQDNGHKRRSDGCEHLSDSSDQETDQDDE